jgi:tetratricopeptide (TPR) repeat protein
MRVDLDEVVPLIREGWEHLHQQSPLAAWGSWRKAIGLDPDSKAAQQALATLESAGELPAAARSRYRFLIPGTDTRRERWDARIRNSEPGELTAAAEVFADAAEDDPGDAEAWYNRGLCLSWTGRNRDAVASLDRFVTLRADSDFETAVSAWTLAEILRQGRGAESIADELRFAVTTSWSPEDSVLLARQVPGLRRLPTPIVPTANSVELPTLNVFEWLERPIFDASSLDSADAEREITVLATLYENARSLRLSSPRAETLEIALERLAQIVDLGDRELVREAAPLPLPFLDADVWTFRLPDGLDPAISDRLTRAHVESYYENQWIHVKRHGLGGRSPLEASTLATGGDRIALAKLTAVIRLREQLGTRSSVGSLYQGYPFDRLRTRLGLEPADGNSVDPDDLASASARTLDRLDPAPLADARLVSAFESADGLRDDRLAEKFATALIGRTTAARRGIDLLKLVGCLVRRRMSQAQANQAIGLIEQLEPEGTDAERLQLTTWRAEILAREGRADDAASLYRRLLEIHPNPAVLALDAAETLLDNGEFADVPAFLERAVRSAREQELQGIERRAKTLLNQGP